MEGLRDPSFGERDRRFGDFRQKFGLRDPSFGLRDPSLDLGDPSFGPGDEIAPVGRPSRLRKERKAEREWGDLSSLLLPVLSILKILSSCLSLSVSSDLEHPAHPVIRSLFLDRRRS